MTSPTNADSRETRPLWALNATELVSGYLAARFTPLDVIESVLERVEEVNSLVNAVVTSDADGARRAAFESTQRHRDGKTSQRDRWCSHHDQRQHSGQRDAVDLG